MEGTKGGALGRRGARNVTVYGPLERESFTKTYRCDGGGGGLPVRTAGEITLSFRSTLTPAARSICCRLRLEASSAIAARRSAMNSFFGLLGDLAISNSLRVLTGRAQLRDKLTRARWPCQAWRTVIIPIEMFELRSGFDRAEDPRAVSGRRRSNGPGWFLWRARKPRLLCCSR
jgi:hypothetical protein